MLLLLLGPQVFWTLNFIQFHHCHADAALVCTETKMDSQNWRKPRQEPESSNEILPPNTAFILSTHTTDFSQFNEPKSSLKAEKSSSWYLNFINFHPFFTDFSKTLEEIALNCVTVGLLPNMMGMRKLLAFWTLSSIIHLPLPPVWKAIPRVALSTPVWGSLSDQN